MQAFSRSILDLYELAHEGDGEHFPDQALGLLRRWVGFDGAVLGMGAACMHPDTQLEITQAHVHARDSTILNDYASVSANDPITLAFVAGLAKPLVVDCRTLYQARRLTALDAFAQTHGLKHLAIFGDRPRSGQPGRWLVLYRSEGRRFAADDAAYLHATWMHLSRAIGINRRAMLERHAPARLQRAAALVDALGRIELADAQFQDLLAQAWPAADRSLLPSEVVHALGRGDRYRGRGLEITWSPRAGLAVCVARALAPIDTLSPGEGAVASRFAAGLSAKRIAIELGVSPHTVRTQITHLYAKLGVHDKAALAQRLRQN